MVALLGIYGTLILSMLDMAANLAEFRAESGGVDFVGQLVGPFGSGIAWFLDLNDDEIAALFKARSPVQVSFFAAALFFAPYVAILAGFDQIADDIRSRNLRYKLFRVERMTLFIARALGVMAVLAVGYGLVIGVATALLAGKPEGLNSVSEYLYMGRIWSSLVMVSFPFVLFLALANVLTSNPYLSIGLLFGVQFMLFVIVSFFVDEFEAIEGLYYLLPGELKFHLIAEEAKRWQLAMAHQVGLATLFGVLGITWFRRRDL